MTLSPLAAARRLHRLIAGAFALSLILQGGLLLWAGKPMLTWALLAAAGGALALWLTFRRGGTPLSMWGLSLLLVAGAVGPVAMVPQRPGLMLLFPLMLSLLPAYRRWPVVAVAGLLMTASTPFLSVPAQPGGLVMLAAFMAVQTAFLSVVAHRNEIQAKAAFDIDFLVRAMGTEGPIRLDLQALRAETALGERLRQAQDRMATTMQQVRLSAHATTQAAQSLQASGQEITQRSQAAGSELSGAAMTLTQIAVIVKDSAEAAMAARQTAQAATSMAEKGGQIVGQMVDQMQAIDAASRRITDIIGVIEGIAFQTNMLALNAAVEAARAGEQGRGFAVVAGEVRSLAQRASASSKEVKALVEDTVAAVTRGGELARQVGSTITDLTATVARVDETFHSLSADTHEHAAGIESIRDTMTELNASTQENVRLAEQSRDIADELAERSAALNAALAGFRLGEASDAVVREAAQVTPTTASRRDSGSSPSGAADSTRAGAQETIEFF